MKSNYKKIGDYIRTVNNRNTNLKVNKLVGLSMTKEFRDTTSNTVGTDMSVYKIVNKWQFACDFMSVIRVHKLPIVLKTDDEPVLVSPAYPVFEVKDINELHPEYLMMWFRRSEFDRYADFKCDSAIRGGYDWNALCDTEIPIPSIEKQRAIVKEYNVIKDRIELNNKLIQNLEETAQAIYKQWFVDFEFPDEDGKPYKSNGGEMVWCEELEKEIPKGWEVEALKDIVNIIDNRGKTPPHVKVKTIYPLLEIASLKTKGRIISFDECSKFLNKNTYNTWFRSGHPQKKDILFSTVGSLAQMKLFWNENGSIAQNIVAFKTNNLGCFLFQQMQNLLKEILSYNIGAVQDSIKVSHIVNIKVIIPKLFWLNRYELISEKISNYIFFITRENENMKKTVNLLLSKLATIND